MPPLVLFSILFICGLINSFFFPGRSKLLQWLLSLLPAMASPPNPTAKASKKEEEGGVTVADTVRLEVVFSTFDRDGDGFITPTELEESLGRLGLAATGDEVAKMVESVDANGDGLIDLEEFRELYVSIEGRGALKGAGGEGDQEEVGLRDVFDVFDRNRDGVISAEELSRVLKTLGLKRSGGGGGGEEDCRRMIREVDLDGDGMVSFEEFKKMMAGELKSVKP